jgi:hypothetical protein
VAEVLVDTDVFVDHLRGARRLDIDGDHVSYSSITRCELFAGHATDESRVRRLLGPFREIPVDRQVAERAGRIRRNHGLRTPDAIIAATTIEHGLVLVTRNRRDFEPVDGLRRR